MFIAVDLGQRVGEHTAWVYPTPDLGVTSSWWGGSFHAGVCYSAARSFPISSKVDPVISGSLLVYISVFEEELGGTGCES